MIILVLSSQLYFTLLKKQQQQIDNLHNNLL